MKAYTVSDVFESGKSCNKNPLKSKGKKSNNKHL